MVQSQMIQAEDNTKKHRMYIAFELSNNNWKLAFGDGFKHCERSISRSISVDRRDALQ